MERKIYKKLLEWKNSTERKPLVMQGARQVGKTYIINTFADREYKNSVYCNFEKDGSLSAFFSNLEPTSILKKLSAYKRKEILPDYTLIIFDEIQACPEALTSLKYFNEEANEYHIVALGSLLGLSTHREHYSFPVGKVNFLDMFPMDFEEYLLAKGEALLVEQIKNHAITLSPLELPFHEKAIGIYKEYLLVGGLPEIVNIFNETNNYDLARNKQQEVLTSYQNDMGKYNKESEIPKTKIVYKNISQQLARENRKFQYGKIKSGGRASDFQNAIEWVCLSGIGAKLNRIEQIKLPLNAYVSDTDFKFFMNDVGLCCASMDIHYDDIYFENPLLNDFKGGLTENYVFNQLRTNGHNLFYWTSKNQAEIDFVTRIKDDIIPIEVKSKDNVKSKSLYIYTNSFEPKYAIRMSQKNFGESDGILSIPLYAVFCIST